MSADRKPWTVPMLSEAREAGRKLVMLTCYDASFARVLDDNGVDLILVGDSLGMVVQGHDSTLPVQVDDIAYHVAAVARGARRALKIADLPFGADATPEQAHAAAVRFIQAGAAMVKLEGAGHKLEIIRYLVDREIPVCAHLGLTPQSVLRFGGFMVQGREEAAAAQLRADAQAVAGAGAGLLVLHDLLGIDTGHRKPRFVRDFLATGGSIAGAVRAYVDAVRDGSFPDAGHSYA